MGIIRDKKRQTQTDIQRQANRPTNTGRQTKKVTRISVWTLTANQLRSPGKEQSAFNTVVPVEKTTTTNKCLLNYM